MRCFFPVPAHRTPDGSVRPGINETTSVDYDELQLRCGRCMGCRIHRKQEWTTRMLLELATHDDACFITLTYDQDGSLNVEDWQSFAHRLRKKVGKFRYYQCGEYGDTTKRRHHHAILFGIGTHHLSSGTGRSGDLLCSTWGLGFTQIGAANSATIGYVAGYVTKKLLGASAKAYDVDQLTGEIINRKPPFATMSLKPGIGEPYYRRWKDQIYPRDEIVIDGRKLRPPEYFDRLYERDDPDAFAELKAKRIESAEEFFADDDAQKRQAGEINARARTGLRTGRLHT